MSDKIKLIKIKNPFDKYQRDIVSVDYVEGQTLLDIRNAHFPQDVPVVTSLNGKIVDLIDLATIKPQHGDCIVFVPEIQGGGDGDGKQILGMIAMVAIAVLAPHALAAIGIGEMTAAGYAIAESTLLGSLAVAGVVMAGGILINSLMPRPKLPSINTDISDFDRTQTYSWNPQTTQQQGTVVPKFYGTNKLYGNIIATHIENINDKQYLNVLISLGLGPYKRLYDFKINDQPAENFQSVEIHTRLGYLNQTPIQNFNDTKTEYPQFIKITHGNPYTYLTVGDDFNGLEVDVTFPQGLYYANDSGGLDSFSVDVKIEIRKQGETNWRSITSQVITTQHTVYTGRWSAGRYEYDSDDNYYWHEYQAGDTNPYSHYEGEEIYIGEPYYTYAYWRWIESSYVQTVSQTVDYVTISGAKTSAIRRTFRVDNLSAGKYEIRVSRLSADQTSARYGSDMYLTAVREIYYDDFEYPRHVLVGIKALATDQLSGSLKFSCMAECSLVRIYDGTNWRVDYSDNPAWVAWDILTKPVFDNNLNVIRYDGLDPSRLDLAKFKELADFCDTLVPDGRGGLEKRITFNGGFDAETTVWDALLTVCQLGRAVPILNARGITLWIDKPTAPTMTFTAGNIIQDSFKETFLPLDERATEIEVDFINRENDYQRDKFSIFNPNITTKTNKISLQLLGCTKPSEAWRHASYKLANNQYLLRSATISAQADAIGCVIGDVVNIAHEVPQWGYSGRLVSATVSSITLDRKVIVEAGKTYTVMIVYSTPSMVVHNGVNYICKLAHTAGASSEPGVGADWTVYWDIGGDGSSGTWTSGKQYVQGDYTIQRTVTNAVGEHETLSIDLSNIDLPRQYDMFSFAEINKITKPFRVLHIQPTQDLEHTLYLIEYNESVYNVDYGNPALPTYNYSSLEFLPTISTLRLEELLIKRKDGTIITALDIYFSKPSSSMFSHAEIWYNKGSVWIYAGNSPTGYYRIENVEEGKTYTVAVVGVNVLGHKQSIQNTIKDSIYIYGKTAKPADVSEFWGQASLGGLRLDWTPVPDVDLDHYVIRYTADTTNGTWYNAIEVARAYTTSITLPAALSGMYLIKAVDTTGNESQNAKSLITNIPAILGWNVQEELIEHPSFTGTKTNMAIYNNKLMLETSASFWDVANVWALNNFWRLDSKTVTEGFYYSDIVNLGSVQTARCSCIIKFYSIDPYNSFWNILNVWEATNIWDTIEGIGLQPQIALSEDGATWGDWQPFFIGDYTAKAFKFRVRAYAEDTYVYPEISELRFIVDMPDRIESGQDVSIPSQGTTITFGKPFMAKPKIGITLQSANAGDYYDLQDVNTTGFTVQIKNSAGTGIAKTIDWEAKGY